MTRFASRPPAVGAASLLLLSLGAICVPTALLYLYPSATPTSFGGGSAPHLRDEQSDVHTASVEPGGGQITPSSTPWAAWKPHSVLLSPPQSPLPLSPPRNLSPAFGRQPHVIDAVLTGRCVYFVTRPSAFILPNLTAPMVVRAAELGHGVELLAVGVDLVHLGSPTAYEWPVVRNRVWCDDRLAGAPNVTLTLSQEWGGEDWVVRTTVQREEGDAAGMRWPLAWDGEGAGVAAASPPPLAGEPPISIGACTMFNEGLKFLTWVRYMRAMGVDTVYGYFTGHVDDLAPFVEDGADLVAAGALRLGEWLTPYHSTWYTEHAVLSQAEAMSSCLDRHTGKHAWMVLMDDDEYLHLEANTTLKRVLAGVGGSIRTVEINSRWAFLNESVVEKVQHPFRRWLNYATWCALAVADFLFDVEMPSDSGTLRTTLELAPPPRFNYSRDFLHHLAAGVQRVGPMVGSLREKHIDSTRAPPEYGVHYHPRFRGADTRGRVRGNLTCLHVSGLGRTPHESVGIGVMVGLVEASGGWPVVAAIGEDLERGDGE